LSLSGVAEIDAELVEIKVCFESIGACEIEFFEQEGAGILA
jgi:hypothetical protein